MSDFYLDSVWCGRERHWFAKALAENDAVFLVKALPTRGTWPAAFVDEGNERLPGYDFHDIKRPNALPFGWMNPEDPNLGMAVSVVAEQLAKHLRERRLRQQNPNGGPDMVCGEAKRTVMLGVTPEDLDDGRTRLRQQLIEAGFTVIAPSRPHNTDDLRSLIDAEAPKCDALVQLCGRGRGIWSHNPEGYILYQINCFKHTGRVVYLVKDQALAVNGLSAPLYQIPIMGTHGAPASRGAEAKGAGGD